MKDFERIDYLEKEVQELKLMNANLLLAIITVHGELNKELDNNNSSKQWQLIHGITATALGRIIHHYNQNTKKGKRTS